MPIKKSEQLVSLWLRGFSSPCTIRNYRTDIDQFLTWLGDKDLLRVDEKDVRNYILDLEEKGLSKRTRNRRLATLKSVYARLSEQGHIKASPAERVKHERLSESEKQIEPLDERVAINLLAITKTDTITGKRIYALIDLLLGTGLRREELANLDVSDAHLSKTQISTIRIRKGKGDKPRVIPLAGPQKESLITWLDVRPLYAKKIKSDAIFVTRIGTRPTGESIRKIIKAKFKQLGIEDKGVAVHALRHLFASAYNEANQNDLVGLQAITGHANLSSVGIYTHPTLKRTKENLEKMRINKNR